MVTVGGMGTATAMVSGSRFRARMSVRKGVSWFVRWLLLVVPLSWGAGVRAGKWDLVPRVDTNLVATDNVMWAPPGKEESDLLGRVAPGIRLEGKGARLSAQLDYQPEAILFVSDSARNRIYHRGQGGMKSEFLDDWLYFDAAGAVGQRILSEQEPLPLDNLGFSSNTTNFTSYSVNPYLRHDFGEMTTALLSYTQGAIEYDSAEASNAYTRNTRFLMESGRSFRVFTWRLGYDEEDIRRPRSYDVFYSDANASAVWRLLDDFSLVGQVGYTENDTGGQFLVIDGSYWSAGGLWHPSRRFSLELQSGNNLDTGIIVIAPSLRTSLRAIYENRSVGVNLGPRWRWRLEHRTRGTTWTGTYFEDTRLSQQRVPYAGDSILVSPGTLELRDPVTGDPIYCTGIDVSDCFTLNDDAYKRRAGRFSVTLDTARSTFGFYLNSEFHDYLTGNRGQRRISGLAGTWDWKLGKRTLSRLLFSWTGHDYPSGAGKSYERKIAQLNLTRQLGPATHGILGYRRVSQSGEEDAPRYTENRIYAQLRVVF